MARRRGKGGRGSKGKMITPYKAAFGMKRGGKSR